MPKQKRRRIIEWLGGVIPMPAVVTGEGEPYRPDTLVWLGAEGALLGHAVAKPGEMVGLVSDSLQRTIESPAFGRPHTPERVRVASPELAAALRAGHPGLEIVCAPTPELDEVAASMRAHMSKNLPEDEPSYLTPEVGPDAVAALFRAAAQLYRAAPWKLVPGDQNLIAVTIESLGVREAAVTVIGQLGESFGLVFFDSIDEFYDYLEAVDSMQNGGSPELPAHFALNFERGADLPVSLRKEIAAHRWEVASPTAYPWLVGIDSDATPCAPDPKEVAVTEAVAIALSQVLSERRALQAAWAGGEPVERALTVTTHAGSIEVELRIPFEADTSEDDELLERFANSPGGKAFRDLQWSGLLVNIAETHFDATLTTLSAAQLREILFQAVPWSVTVAPAAAPLIVDELRALYGFLKRDLDLDQADDCLAVLGGDASKKLAAALDDPSQFGPAKLAFLAEQMRSSSKAAKRAPTKKPTRKSARKKR